MIHKTTIPPKEVSRYFNKKYPTKQGHRHYFYWYWATEQKREKVYGCNVARNNRPINKEEGILEWYNK